jgi:hypothetical protein
LLIAIGDVCHGECGKTQNHPYVYRDWEASECLRPDYNKRFSR